MPTPPSQTIKLFYLSSFLKTQRFFLPVIVIFLLGRVSLFEVFIIFAAGSLARLLWEVPSGIVADISGKRRAIILSRSLYIPAFLLFGLGNDFWFFLVAQVIYETAQAFKSGTHKAYMYDYLEDRSHTEEYTTVLGNTKFYSRMGDITAALLGGFIATIHIEWVFLASLVPASANIFLAFLYPHIGRRVRMRHDRVAGHVKECYGVFKKDPLVLGLVINLGLFIFVISDAFELLVQPYLLDAGLTLFYFGMVYAAISLVAAFGVRYTKKFESILGDNLKTMQVLDILAALCLLSLFLPATLFGLIPIVILFLLHNLKSTIAVNEINKRVNRRHRATILSVRSLFTGLLGVTLLPIIGIIATLYGIRSALLLLFALMTADTLILRRAMRKERGGKKKSGRRNKRKNGRKNKRRSGEYSGTKEKRRRT